MAVQDPPDPAAGAAPRRTRRAARRGDYLLQEQAQRRQELENGIARIEADFRYGILLAGAIWSWFGTQLETLDRLHPLLVCGVALLPVALMGFFWFRARVIRRSIESIAAYTRGLESALALPEIGLGWETWLARQRRQDRRFKGPQARTTDLFWALMVSINLVLALGLVLSWYGMSL